MKLTLGFSPCPNDTFIFDALVHKKIDTAGLDFEVLLADVQTLNEWSIQQKLDFSKISYGVLPLITQHCIVLNSGSALGKGVGPLLITLPGKGESWRPQAEAVAIPGENTTAHLLFSLAYPHASNKQFMVFNEIEDAVLHQRVAAGVIIHENRFTYMDKGLVKLEDLGSFWERTTGSPIPLGGIVANRRLTKELINRVDGLIRESIEYAFKHYPEVGDYVRANAQEMSETVMRQHIDLYVNQFSISLGLEGKSAIVRLLEVYRQMHPSFTFNPDELFTS